MKKYFLFLILLSLSKVNAGVEVKPEPPKQEIFQVACDLEGCNKKYPATWVVERKTDNNNDPIIFWLSGGSGKSTGLDPIDKLEGKFHIILFVNPYDNRIGRNKGYCPECYSKDQAQRIKSIILFYKNKYNKPIWLGGQSFGAPRILNYLSYSEENSKLIEGAILTASAVGNPIRTSIKKIKDLNIPVAIIHHTRDVCKYSNFKIAKEFSEQFAKINLNKTEFIEVSAGNLPKDNSQVCDPAGANHMFNDSGVELADEIIKFIKIIIGFFD